MSIYENHDLGKEFFSIIPRSRQYLDYNIQPIYLKVNMSNGVDVTPDVDFTVNDLSLGKKQYVNHSGKCDRFKINVVIRADEIRHFERNEILSVGTDIDNDSIQDMINDPSKVYMWSDLQGAVFLPKFTYKETEYHYEVDVPVTRLLDYYIKAGEPFYVCTNAIDVPDDYYLIISNGSRKQTYDNTVHWDLEFIRYRDFSIASFKNTNTAVKKAITNYNNKKLAKQQKADKKKEEGKNLKKKLKKCDRKKLVYSKKKKSVPCVKTMQLLLIYYNCLKNSKDNKDGWFGKVTKEAVIKFQKKYKKKYGLKDNGKVNKATFKALYTGGSTKVTQQVGKTKTITGNLPTGIIISK